MKPVKTPASNVIYHLEGGNEDNDLFVQRAEPGRVYADWDLEPNERLMVAAGARIRLGIYSEPIPPVSVEVAWTHCRACKTWMTLAGDLRSGYVFACSRCGDLAVDKAGPGDVVRISKALAGEIRELLAQSINLLEEQRAEGERNELLERFSELYIKFLAAS